ncbi:hypothetical protein QC761_211980 [Podospora bellae-mahoneyi]|uniref:Uncharacterized protein n=1 Tax=Podospora bellae-mahoneyi TaxID=2093777 RepID=A0ABR0FRM3_9PEZI|nr:hypothetical protein QC761_211980 [Podospora bellae-mahoneyi]
MQSDALMDDDVFVMISSARGPSDYHSVVTGLCTVLSNSALKANPPPVEPAAHDQKHIDSNLFRTVQSSRNCFILRIQKYQTKISMTSKNESNANNTSPTNASGDNAHAELTVQLEDLLNTLSNKFAGVSSEIFAKMDEMSRRLDNLEAQLAANKDKKSSSG